MRPIDETASKYGQLYAVFYEKIASGAWQSGYKLLPERELCTEYGVSRITVRETLRLLEEQGLLYRRQGSGTFVQRKPVEQKLTKLYTLREHFQQQGIGSEASILEFSLYKADAAMAEKLAIPPGERVIKIVRLFLAAQTPYALETTYLPHRYFPGMNEESVRDNGLYNTFSALGVVIQRAVERLMPQRLSKATAQLLGVSPNEVAMRIERTTYSRAAIIEYTESIVRGEFFVYTVELN